MIDCLTGNNNNPQNHSNSPGVFNNSRQVRTAILNDLQIRKSFEKTPFSVVNADDSRIIDGN